MKLIRLFICIILLSSHLSHAMESVSDLLNQAIDLYEEICELNSGEEPIGMHNFDSVEFQNLKAKAQYNIDNKKSLIKEKKSELKKLMKKIKQQKPKTKKQKEEVKLLKKSIKSL